MSRRELLKHVKKHFPYVISVKAEKACCPSCHRYSTWHGIVCFDSGIKRAFTSSSKRGAYWAIYKWAEEREL